MRQTVSLLFVSLLCFSALPANAQGPPPPRGPHGEEGGMQDVFFLLDENGDGQVGHDEFMTAANWLFDQLSELSGDTNRLISLQEFQEAMPQILDDEGPGGGAPPDPAAMFAHIDENGDGLVYAQEIEHPDLRRAMEQWLASQGRTGEGLAREEFIAFLERAMAHQPPWDGPRSRRPRDEEHRRDPGEVFDHLDGNQDRIVVPSEVDHPALRSTLEHWLVDQGREGEGLRREEFIAFLEENFGFRPEGDHRRAAPSGTPGAGPSQESMQARAFDRSDLNNDGVLSLDEIEPHERENFKMQLRMFGRAEDDGLSREEFLNGPVIDRSPRPDAPPEVPPTAGGTPLSLD